MTLFLAGFLGEWALVMILTFVLLLYAARKLLALSSDNSPKHPSPFGESAKLWLAQGFGVGRIPFAPGTFGSMVGLLWFGLLVSSGNFWGYLVGAIEGVALSIWLCGSAEKTLRQTDPGSVVLDEIIAIPFCFLPWVTAEWLRAGHAMPALEVFFGARAWISSLLIMALFRLFDIWKPWPIRQLQSLPGGLGVTVDDVLAGVYVALISLLFVT